MELFEEAREKRCGRNPMMVGSYTCPTLALYQLQKGDQETSKASLTARSKRHLDQESLSKANVPPLCFTDAHYSASEMLRKDWCWELCSTQS